MAELAIRPVLIPLASIDLDATAAVINAAFAKYVHLFEGNRTSPDGLREEAGDASAFLQVQEGGTLIATAMIKPGSELSAEEQHGFAGIPMDSTLYFGLAAVHPGRMSTGLGRTLVAAAEEEARRRGFSWVVLGTVREFELVPYYESQRYVLRSEEQYPAGYWTFFAPFSYCAMAKPL